MNAEFLAEYIDENNKLNIPIGVEKNSLNVHYYPFGTSYINMIMSSGMECYDFAADLVRLMNSTSWIKGIVFDMPKSVDSDGEQLCICTSANECENQIDRLFDLVLYRNNTYKEAIEKSEPVETFENILVVINSLSSLKASLTDQGREKLALILEKGTVMYNVNIIIAEQVKNISAVSFEKWYKANVSPSDGIWVGSGITEQYQMKANKTTSEMHEEISQEFGFSLVRGRCVKLKLLNSRMEVEDDE